MQPLLQWKNNNYLLFRECTCSLRYPACIVHALYCHPCPARLYTIFPYYLTNGAILGKEIVELTKCVLIFPTNFVRNIFHSKKNWARYDRKYILVFMWSNRHSCQMLMKLEIFWTDIRKILKCKISVQWEPSCSMRTDGQTDMTELIDAFSNFANAPKN